MLAHRRILLLLAATVCFTVALLLSLTVLTGSNEEAWKLGGLLALTLSLVP